jgi:hypothetical protein
LHTEIQEWVALHALIKHPSTGICHDQNRGPAHGSTSSGAHHRTSRTHAGFILLGVLPGAADRLRSGPQSVRGTRQPVLDMTTENDMPIMMRGGVMSRPGVDRPTIGGPLHRTAGPAALRHEHPAPGRSKQQLCRTTTSSTTATSSGPYATTPRRTGCASRCRSTTASAW